MYLLSFFAINKKFNNNNFKQNSSNTMALKLNANKNPYKKSI